MILAEVIRLTWRFQQLEVRPLFRNMGGGQTSSFSYTVPVSLFDSCTGCSPGGTYVNNISG